MPPLLANVVIDHTQKCGIFHSHFPQFSDGHFRTSAVLHFRILGLPCVYPVTDNMHTAEEN